MNPDLRILVYPFVDVVATAAPFAVAFWSTATCLSALTMPLFGAASAVAATMSVFALAYFAVVSLAANTVRVALQPPWVKPSADLRDVATP